MSSYNNQKNSAPLDFCKIKFKLRESKLTMTNQKMRKNKTVIICISIVISALGFFYLQKSIAENSSDDILHPYIEADVKIEAAIMKINISNDRIPSKKIETLKNQYLIIKDKKKHHLKITKMMNAYYFASTLSLAILTIILGVFIIRISGEGLKSKSITFRTMFYTLLSLTTFFGVLIQILDHKENISTNKNTFIAYSSTQLRIYNYLVTGGALDMRNKKEKQINVDNIIMSINQEINTINNITFGIEHERIKSANEILERE